MSEAEAEAEAERRARREFRRAAKAAAAAAASAPPGAAAAAAEPAAPAPKRPRREPPAAAAAAAAAAAPPSAAAPAAAASPRQRPARAQQPRPPAAGPRQQQPATAAPRPPPPPPAAAPAADAPDGGCEVFVKFLPRDADEAEVAQLFGRCGPLAGPGPGGSAVSLLRDFSTGAPKGAGWVTFAAARGAAAAVASLHGAPLRGRHLEVTLARGRKERPSLRGQLQPAGTHTPALLAEVVAALVTGPHGGGAAGAYVDATFGRGGHSRGLLAALGPSGALHGLDMDAEAVAAGGALAGQDGRFTMHATRFSRLRAALAKPLRGRLSGVLFDLGLSSPQLDDPGRGMRPEADGPLDLRFDTTRGEPAWRLLQTLPRAELAALLARYGDGQDAASAGRVADAVALYKQPGGPGVPTTTAAFGRLVAACRPGPNGDYQPMHPAKLSVQALRMAVNDERGELGRGLGAAFGALALGGVLAVITWKHSEAALVTDFLRGVELAPPDFPARAWWEAAPPAPPAAPAGGPGAAAAAPPPPPPPPRPPLAMGLGLRRLPAVRPGEAELRANARSRSAVLHVFVKERGVTVADAQAAVYKELGWAPLELQPLHAL